MSFSPERNAVNRGPNWNLGREIFFAGRPGSKDPYSPEPARPSHSSTPSPNQSTIQLGQLPESLQARVRTLLSSFHLLDPACPGPVANVLPKDVRKGDQIIFKVNNKTFTGSCLRVCMGQNRPDAVDIRGQGREYVQVSLKTGEPTLAELNELTVIKISRQNTLADPAQVAIGDLVRIGDRSGVVLDVNRERGLRLTVRYWSSTSPGLKHGFKGELKSEDTELMISEDGMIFEHPTQSYGKDHAIMALKVRISRFPDTLPLPFLLEEGRSSPTPVLTLPNLALLSSSQDCSVLLYREAGLQTREPERLKVGDPPIFALSTLDNGQILLSLNQPSKYGLFIHPTGLASQMSSLGFERRDEPRVNYVTLTELDVVRLDNLSIALGLTVAQRRTDRYSAVNLQVVRELEALSHGKALCVGRERFPYLPSSVSRQHITIVYLGDDPHPSLVGQSVRRYGVYDGFVPAFFSTARFSLEVLAADADLSAVVPEDLERVGMTPRIVAPGEIYLVPDEKNRFGLMVPGSAENNSFDSLDEWTVGGLERRGKDDDEQSLSVSIAESLSEGLGNFLAGRGLTPEQEVVAYAVLRRYYRALGLARTGDFEGAEGLLESLARLCKLEYDRTDLNVLIPYKLSLERERTVQGDPSGVARIERIISFLASRSWFIRFQEGPAEFRQEKGLVGRVSPALAVIPNELRKELQDKYKQGVECAERLCIERPDLMTAENRAILAHCAPFQTALLEFMPLSARSLDRLETLFRQFRGLLSLERAQNSNHGKDLLDLVTAVEQRLAAQYLLRESFNLMAEEFGHGLQFLCGGPISPYAAILRRLEPLWRKEGKLRYSGLEEADVYLLMKHVAKTSSTQLRNRYDERDLVQKVLDSSQGQQAGAGIQQALAVLGVKAAHEKIEEAGLTIGAKPDQTGKVPALKPILSVLGDPSLRLSDHVLSIAKDISGLYKLQVDSQAAKGCPIFIERHKIWEELASRRVDLPPGSKVRVGLGGLRFELP